MVKTKVVTNPHVEECLEGRDDGSEQSERNDGSPEEDDEERDDVHHQEPAESGRIRRRSKYCDTVSEERCNRQKVRR